MSVFSWSDIPPELQARVSAGDCAVLNPLAAWLHSHPPRNVTEDVLQKVLSTLVGLMSNEHGRSMLLRANNIADLLAAIATRLRSNEKRSNQRLRRHLAEAARHASKIGSVDPIHVIAQAEVRDAILASLSRLTPIEREALVRAVVFGESYRSIASALLADMRGPRSEQRLRALVHRARQKLRARLRSLGED
jgi:DNA-directed RNA polymerase specialized sigma24 family protein